MEVKRKIVLLCFQKSTGIMHKQDIETDLGMVAQAVKMHTNPVAIYLFGSWAYGKPREDSDMDVYVVAPDSETDVIELGAKIRYDLYKKMRFPLDLVVGRQSLFERKRKGATLENIVAQKGIRVDGH
jgi:predicted nucleotidyltransferase